jgi:hypothetical protein
VKNISLFSFPNRSGNLVYFEKVEKDLSNIYSKDNEDGKSLNQYLASENTILF